jgi:hypothetical protein
LVYNNNLGKYVTSEQYEARIRALLNALHVIGAMHNSSFRVIREMAKQAIMNDGIAAGQRSETERGMD